MPALHEPTEPGRAEQRRKTGQEQAYNVFYPPRVRPRVPGKVVPEPVGQRAGPGRRSAVVHPQLPGRAQPSGAHAGAHDRTATRIGDYGRQGRRRRERGGRDRGRGGRGLLSGTSPRAVAHPQRAAGDHGQTAQGRGGRRDHERLEVRRHGDRSHVSVHIHVLHGSRHYSGAHVRAARDRHVIASPTPVPVPAADHRHSSSNDPNTYVRSALENKHKKKKKYQKETKQNI